MAKSKSNLADYAIMVEPLSDADGGGWLATVPALPGAGSLGQWRQRVPRSLHEKLKCVAAREGLSLNAYVAGVMDGTRAACRAFRIRVNHKHESCDYPSYS